MSFFSFDAAFFVRKNSNVTRKPLCVVHEKADTIQNDGSQVYTVSTHKARTKDTFQPNHLNRGRKKNKKKQS